MPRTEGVDLSNIFATAYFMGVVVKRKRTLCPCSFMNDLVSYAVQFAVGFTSCELVQKDGRTYFYVSCFCIIFYQVSETGCQLFFSSRHVSLHI